MQKEETPLAKKPNTLRDNSPLNKTQSVLYQREFKRADRVYEKQKHST
ncbi:MAG: YfhE family protein [Tuberibacillus sp.]